MTFITDNL